MKAVIFDMDGVLLDSEPVHYEAARQLLAAHGKEFTFDLHEKFVGVTEQYFWEAIIKHFDLKEDWKELMKKKERLYQQLLGTKALALPGVIELLQKLQHTQLAVASSSPREEVEMVLKKIKVHHFFDVIVSGDDVKLSKPNPEIYLLAATKLGITPQECIGIEDALHGVKAVKAAGMKCIGITTSFSQKELKAAGADDVIHNFAQFDLRWVA